MRRTSLPALQKLSLFPSATEMQISEVKVVQGQVQWFQATGKGQYWPDLPQW